MSLSMYQASVPVFVRLLGNLAEILRKAEANAAARKIDPAVFLQTRLAPDMFPLVRQVQIAADAAKSCAANLAGLPVPSYPDDETSFAELQARIAKTVAFIESVPAAQIDGSEAREIVIKRRDSESRFQGQPYLLSYVFPNFFFHITTTYAILRHNGVDLGKRDYLGPF